MCEPLTKTKMMEHTRSTKAMTKRPTQGVEEISLVNIRGHLSAPVQKREEKTSISSVVWRYSSQPFLISFGSDCKDTIGHERNQFETHFQTVQIAFLFYFFSLQYVLLLFEQCVSSRSGSSILELSLRKCPTVLQNNLFIEFRFFLF